MAHRDDVGPVPEDNRPGHHPEVEQDQPPAEAFARRLGLVPPPEGGPEADGGPGAAEDPGGAADDGADALTTVEAALALSGAEGGGPDVDAPEWLAEALPPVAPPVAGSLGAAVRDAAGPPAGPVTPVEVVAETLELGVRFATAVALLPLRVTTASVRMALRVGGHDR